MTAIGSMLRVRRPPPLRWWQVLLVLAVPFAIFYYLPRLWAWIAVATIVAIAVGFLPLFGTLGFELATAMAPLAALLGADVGRAYARELQQVPSSVTGPAWPGRTMACRGASAAALAAAVMMIPAVVSAIRGLWQTTCDWSYGITAYIAMPLATAALAGATGFAIGTAIGPRRLATLLAQLPAFVVACAAGYRFYAAPPVFSYNAIFGYFPGNLYDENIQLTAALAWSRLEQLLWVAALLALVALRLDVASARIRRAPRPAGRRWGPLCALLACALGAGVLRTNSGELDYAPDTEDVIAALPGRIETPHFIIHYARTPEIDAQIALIAADHEFRYAQVVAQLGAAPDGKLVSLYFANTAQKARLLGLRNVEMVKPWRHEIYVDHQDFPHEVLRHEIGHAVASAFGDPIFGIAAGRVLGLPLRINPGLIEGLAECTDWPGRRQLTPHEASRAMQKLEVLPSIDSLLGVSFYATSSIRGYTAAGSFLRYLFDRYGAAKLRDVYANGGDFDGVYGQSLATLERGWREMLARLDMTDAVVESQREAFRRGSVFQRPCPHAIAAKRDAAERAPDRATAVALMRDVCTEAPDEPSYFIALADYLGAGDPRERAEANEIWSRIAVDAMQVTSSLRAEAFERLARTAGQRGDTTLAATYVAAAQRLPVQPSQLLAIDGMGVALAHVGAGAPALRDYYFHGGGAQKIVDAEPELALGHYLLALESASATEFARALERPLPSPSFVRDAARRLAVAAYKAHDRARLAIAIAVLAGAGMPEVDRWLARDWSQRLDFDDHTGMFSGGAPSR